MTSQGAEYHILHSVTLFADAFSHPWNEHSREWRMLDMFVLIHDKEGGKKKSQCTAPFLVSAAVSAEVHSWSAQEAVGEYFSFVW